MGRLYLSIQSPKSMLFCHPWARTAVPWFIRNFLFYLCLSVAFSCHPLQAPQTYVFVKTGSWGQSTCWQGGVSPGNLVLPNDTVIINAGIACIENLPTPVINQGAIKVFGSIGILDSLYNNGQVVLSPRASLGGNGYFYSGGRLQVGVNAYFRFGGTVVTGTNSRTINDGLIECGMLQIGGRFANDSGGTIHVAASDSASVAMALDSFVNRGSVLIDGSISYTSVKPLSGYTNNGLVRCQTNGVLWLGTYLKNDYYGVISLTDQGSLHVLPNGILNTQGSLSTGRNTLLDNRGSINNVNYMRTDGPMINLGVFNMSNALNGKTPQGSGPASWILTDTVYNGKTLQVVGGKVSGPGPLVNYFGVSAKGYTGPAMNYQITGQPVNFACGSPCIATFTARTGGGPVLYQWQYSTDNGVTWNSVPSAPPFSGWNTAQLTITQPDKLYLTAVYRCQLQGVGPGNVTTTNRVLIYLPAKK